MRKKGFTLIELIVVIAILAILAAIAIPALNHYVDEYKIKILEERARTIFMYADMINSDIELGTVPKNNEAILSSMNSLLPPDTQVDAVISPEQASWITADGNYITVNDNKITNVYVIYDGNKVKYDSSGVSG